MIRYRGIEMDMVPAHGYGQYKIIAKVGDIAVTLHDTESEVYGWFYDEGDNEEENAKHLAALDYVYMRVRYSCEVGIYQDEYLSDDCTFSFSD